MMQSSENYCTSCKRGEAFFFRHFSGQRLCKKCFSASIEKKVRATTTKYGMFDFNDRIAVAVSGGKDSISMLHILAKMKKYRPEEKLIAITIDEGIAGYRDEALEIASYESKKLGIFHRTISFRELFGYSLDELVKRKADRTEKLTACAFCGVLRRRAMNILAREVSANKIATAHTLDDVVQTNLMNVFRGDLERFACGKPTTDEADPKLIRKVKPLCEIPEKETALYAYVNNIKFQNTPCPYASDALRNDFRLMLNSMEEKHPGIKFSVFNSLERLRLGLSPTSKAADFCYCSRCGEPSADRLCKVCEMLGI